LPQALARWRRDRADAFERDHVEAVQAWLQWRDGEMAAPRERLDFLPGGCAGFAGDSFPRRYARGRG